MDGVILRSGYVGVVTFGMTRSKEGENRDGPNDVASWLRSGIRGSTTDGQWQGEPFLIECLRVSCERVTMRFAPRDEV